MSGAEGGLGGLPPTVAVGDVMRTFVVSVSPQTPLAEVVRIMLREEIRFIPVVDGEALVGVITNTDLVERGALPLRLELHGALGRVPSTPPRTADDVMTPHPVTVLPSQTIHEAARIMLEQRVKRLPAVDHGRLVGLVSRVDLLHVVSRVLAPDVAVPAPVDARTAGDIAVPDVPTVHRDTPLDEALDAVLSTRLNRAVVVDDARLVLGILTDAELLRRIDRPDRTILDRLMRRRVEGAPVAAATAGDLMVSPVVTVHRDLPIAAAIRRMLAEQHKLLPVVDGEGRLCGMVDRADALRAAFTADAGRPPPP